MIGPRNSVMRTLLGEDVTLDELLGDASQFVNTEEMTLSDCPELWVDRIHDHVGDCDVA